MPAADPVLSGTLVKDEIEAVILANLQRFKECYLTHVKGVSPRWRVLSSFVVDPGGSVSSARMMGSPSNKAGENCMTGVLASLQFPSPRGGKAQVKYPFDFSPPVDKKAQEAKQVASALDFLSDAPPKKGKNSGPNKASSSTADATSITNMGMASKALSGSSSSLNKIAGSADSGSGPISTGGRAGGKMGGVMGGTEKARARSLEKWLLDNLEEETGRALGRQDLKLRGQGSSRMQKLKKHLRNIKINFSTVTRKRS